MSAPEPVGKPFAPALPEAAASAWAAIAAVLADPGSDPARALAASLPERLEAVPEDARPPLRAAALVAIDLARQGWVFQLQDTLTVAPPAREADAGREKARVRAQLHVARDQQLQEPSVKAFLRRMETRRLFHGRWVSVFDLMRDGRALAERLRAANALEAAARPAALAEAIQPYLQAVDEKGRCAHTGLLLRDIWRYFRHTWATPYLSVPGRGLLFLVRDAAARHHPVMGIAMLTSAPAQISCRDAWIGWHPEAMLKRLCKAPTDEHARWLAAELRRCLHEIYVQDFLEDGLLAPSELRLPTPKTLSRLRAEARRAREEHNRFARSQDHKRQMSDAPEDDGCWERRARTALFRSKRATLLADLLHARRLFQEHLGEAPDAAGLAALLAHERGSRAARAILRRAKADRMGVAIAEISVCGAVAPYNELLGGKLVALLMASPEVRAIYAERYAETPSVIASSTAGRPIVRGAQLNLLTTSSLFHVAAAQYNRLSVPADAIGGREGRVLRYERLGLTRGFGSSHFSVETVCALERLCSDEHNVTRVNSIFGEGINPRLRKLRQGLDILLLPSELLLQHGSQRWVYGVTLVENLTDSLLGIAEPIPLVPESEPRRTTEALVAWWRKRWLDGRARQEEVLRRVDAHRVRPQVRHGARVPVMENHPIHELDEGVGRQLLLFPRSKVLGNKCLITPGVE